MQHHVEMIFDHIGGLVQFPCIERNTIGTIKAIKASQLVMKSSPDFAEISIDKVMDTMKNKAIDLHSKYKETADVRLAIQLPLRLSEC